MPSTIKAARSRGRSKRMSGEFHPAMMANQIGITAIAKATSVMTITFNQAVSLDGVPKYTTSIAGVTAISAAQTAPNIIAVTFSAAITTATTLNIPHNDPAIRNASGGYVVSTTFPA